MPKIPIKPGKPIFSAAKPINRVMVPNFTPAKPPAARAAAMPTAHPANIAHPVNPTNIARPPIIVNRPPINVVRPPVVVGRPGPVTGATHPPASSGSHLPSVFIPPPPVAHPPATIIRPGTTVVGKPPIGQPVHVAPPRPGTPVPIAHPQVTPQINNLRFIDPNFAKNIIGLRPPTEGVTRDQIKTPICPNVDVTDEVLFEDPAQPAKKFFLPRYQLV